MVDNLAAGIINKNSPGTPSGGQGGADQQRRMVMAMAMRAMPGLGAATAGQQKLGG